MKRILIIAGPNGAGKTSFAEEYLPNEARCPEFVNADLIAAGLSPFQPEKVAFAAGRLMLARIGELVDGGKCFAFETTLSSRLYLRLIPKWQKAGYRVTLHFLKLPDPEFAISRVERRIHFGGHAIPPETIRRRYKRGWENLQNGYLDMVDDWSIYDSSRNPPYLLESGENRGPDKLMEDSTTYITSEENTRPVSPLDSSYFIGVEAALKRASAKAVARDLAAGLEPVIERSVKGSKVEPNKT